MITLEYPRNIRQPDGYVETLAIDAAPEESYNHFALATENPVERGAVVSDHTIINPITLAFRCVISNTPMSGPLQIIRGQAVGITAGVVSAFIDNTRVTRAYQTLLALRDYSPPIRVITGWGPEYNDMVVETFLVNREVSTANSLVFQLGLKHIRFAISTTTEAKRQADPAEDRGKAKSQRGGQPKKEKAATPQETAAKDKGSALYQIFF